MNHQWVLLITDQTAYLGRYEGKRSPQRVRLFDWPIGPHILPRERTDLLAFGETLGRQIAEIEPSGMAARLIFPSSWCFIRPVDCTGVWSTQEATLAVEEPLPIELERLTCAAWRCGSRNGIVAAAVTEGLCGLIDGLSRHGIEVESLVPDVLLPVEPPDGTDCSAILDQGRLTTFAIGRCQHDDRGIDAIIRTIVLPSAQQPDIDSALRSIGAAHAPAVRRVFLLDDQIVVPPATDSAALQVVPREKAVLLLLDRAAAADDFPDLRTGDLAYGGRYRRLRRRAEGCLAAALLLAAAVNLEMRLENRRYTAAAAKLEPITAFLYRQAFADARVPAGAALRLRSERIQLEGLTHAARVPETSAATGLESLQLLHVFAAHAPPHVKLDLSEIVLDENGIQVAGQTTSHDVAGELVRTLNGSSGLEVDPPRTKLRTDKTVDFRIVARRRQEPQP